MLTKDRIALLVTLTMFRRVVGMSYKTKAG